MAKVNAPLLALNRGLVASSALVRTDVDRIRLSAEVMTNWLPKTAGSMFLRTGTEYLGSSRSDAFAINIPFVAATNDTALIEMADGKMRVRVDDALVARVAVSTVIANGNFATSAGWSDGSTSGGTLTFGSGLTLNAVNVGGLALCRRQITVAGGDIGERHALSIEIARGPVTFRCGSSSGGDEYISETALRTGSHSLAFTPSGNFWVQFQSDKDIDRVVASCTIAAAGTMELDIPYSADALPSLRWDQSADVVFLACDGFRQRRLERRSTDSWSSAIYTPDSGPFFAARSASVKMKVGATSGNTTLESDKPFFKPEHVGALFRLNNSGYSQPAKLGDENTFSEPIRVSGVGTDLNFNVILSGTWSGTITLQRSFDSAETGFADVPTESSTSTNSDTTGTYTINGTKLNKPGNGLDNVIHWYRLGFKTGNYTSGVATALLSYQGGGGVGVCRVLSYTNSMQVEIEVLNSFNSTEYTDDWQEGIWSDKQGYPSGVSLHKGRLFWAGKSRFVGSVSDDYENFDPVVEGDSGPINRTLGAGPVDTINFMLSLTRLIVGTPGGEFSIKSSSLDEPLTPQNTQSGDPSTQGSRMGCCAVKIDNRGVFAQRSGKRLFELVFGSDTYEYEPRDLTLLCPDLTGEANVSGMAVQRQPDTRNHVWLDDGAVMPLTYEPSEEVTCWSRIEMGGAGHVENVAILPSEDEDRVYYWVRRTINGVTRRYLEKFALERDCVGGTINRQADSFLIIPSVTGTVVAGLGHLEGMTVVAWGGGKDLGSFIVESASITLNEAVTATDVLVGLPYVAEWKSSKLAYAAQAGTALAQIKKVTSIALILGTVHNDGIEFGRDFDGMDGLPRAYRGRPVEASEVFSRYEEASVTFPGEWAPDARLCLRARAPRPCVVEAVIVGVETNERL